MSKKSRFYLMYMIPAMLFLGLRYVASILPLADNYVEWIFSFCSQILLNFGLVVVLYLIMNRDGRLGSVSDAFYLKPPKKMSASAWTLIIVLPFIVRFASVGVSYLSQVFLMGTGFTSVSGAGTIYSSPWVFVAEIVTTAVFPAFCEEIYNRGVLLSALDDRPDGIGKILFMGLMFGLFHQNVQQFFYTFFAGCVFAVVAIRTKSILPGVYLHFVNNFLSVLYDYCSQRGNVLGQLYDMFYETILPNFFLVVLVAWGLAFAAVVYILKSLMTENKILSLREEIVEERKDDDFFSLADKIRYEFDKPFEEVVEVKEKKTFADYGFAVATIVVTALSTIATYVWGVLR